MTGEGTGAGAGGHWALEVAVAWRHLRADQRPRWVRITLWIGLVALAVGVMLVASDLTAAPGGPVDPTTPPGEGGAAVGLIGLVGVGLGFVGAALTLFGVLAARLSLLATLITLSVAVGCTALVVVLSLMGGLGLDLQGKILGQEGHLRIVHTQGGRNFSEYGAIVEAAEALPEIAGASPFLAGDVMVRSDFNRLGARLIGIEPTRHAAATGIKNRIERGFYRHLTRPENVPIRDLRPAPAPRLKEPVEAPTPPPAVAPPEDTKATDEVDEGWDDDDWEDPSVEIPRLVEDGALPGYQPPPDAADIADLPPPPTPPEAPAGADGGDGDEDDGWEDPSEEVPRLVANGQLPGYGTEPANGGETHEPPPVRQSARRGAVTTGGGPAPVVGTPVLTPLLLGRELLAELGVQVGVRVQLITPVPRLTPAGEVPGVLAARVAAVFNARLYKYDSTFLYAPLDRVQALLKAQGHVSGIELRLRDPEALDAGRAAVARVLAEQGRDHDLEVRDWRGLNRNLFSAMLIEKAAMSVALLFVILVAAFGILATSLMSVLERAPEIAILKAMGASDRSVSRIFVFEGFVLGAMGSVAGVLAGLAVCAVATRIGLPVDESVFYIQRLPLVVKAHEVVAVGVSAVAIVWLSSLYPARAAARMRPVDALRSLDN